MPDKNCEQCNDPFSPREAKQRFCCRACSDEWFQNERREAVRLLRQSAREEGSTHFSRASADDDAPGGRWAKPPAHVTGSTTLAPMLPAPTWTQARIPDEPPLGMDVNALPDLGMPAQRES